MSRKKQPATYYFIFPASMTEEEMREKAIAKATGHGVIAPKIVALFKIDADWYRVVVQGGIEKAPVIPLV